MKVNKLSQLLTEKFKTLKNYKNKIIKIRNFLELSYDKKKFTIDYNPKIAIDYQKLTHADFIKKYQKIFNIPEIKKNSFDSSGYSTREIELSYMFLINFKDNSVASLVFSLPKNVRFTSQYLSGHTLGPGGDAGIFIYELNINELNIRIEDILTFESNKKIELPKTTKPKVDID